MTFAAAAAATADDEEGEDDSYLPMVTANRTRLVIYFSVDLGRDHAALVSRHLPEGSRKYALLLLELPW